MKELIKKIDSRVSVAVSAGAIVVSGLNWIFGNPAEALGWAAISIGASAHARLDQLQKAKE